MSIKPTTRNREIDRLRAIAIIITIWFHLRFLFPWTMYYPYLLDATWTGVDLFFVISGFIVSQALIPNLDDSFLVKDGRSGRPSPIKVVTTFYKKRLYRLLPLNWFWLIISALCSLYLKNTEIFGSPSDISKEILAIFCYVYNYFLYFNGSDHLVWHWTLSMEEQFYFLFPIFLLFFRTLRSRILILTTGIVIIAIVLRPFFPPNPAWDWPDYRTASHYRFDEIMMGCLLYLASISHEGYTKFIPVGLRRSSWFGPLITVVLVLALCLIPSTFPRVPILGYPVIGFCSAALVYLASLKEGLLFSVGRTDKILDWFGTRSYGLYLAHWPVFRLTRYFWDQLARKSSLTIDHHFVYLYLITAFTALAVIVELGYQFIEMPFIEKGRKLNKSFKTAIGDHQKSYIQA